MDSGLVPCVITADMKKDYLFALKNASLGNDSYDGLGKLFEIAAFQFRNFCVPYLDTFLRINENSEKENNISEKIILKESSAAKLFVDAIDFGNSSDKDDWMIERNPE